MTANLCCESTGRHAMEEGYDVTFLSDAMGAASLPEYEAAIRLNLPLIANAVMTVDEFLAAVAAPRRASRRAAGRRGPGLRPREIGTVDESSGRRGRRGLPAGAARADLHQGDLHPARCGRSPRGA
jgi:hypothetical protein